jgi:hypothetical protein
LDAIGFTLREFQPVEEIFVGFDFAVHLEALANELVGNAQTTSTTGDSDHHREAVDFG